MALFCKLCCALYACVPDHLFNLQYTKVPNTVVWNIQNCGRTCAKRFSVQCTLYEHVQSDECRWVLVFGHIISIRVNALQLHSLYKTFVEVPYIVYNEWKGTIWYSEIHLIHHSSSKIAQITSFSIEIGVFFIFFSKNEEKVKSSKKMKVVIFDSEFHETD